MAAASELPADAASPPDGADDELERALAAARRAGQRGDDPGEIAADDAGASRLAGEIAEDAQT